MGQPMARKDIIQLDIWNDRMEPVDIVETSIDGESHILPSFHDIKPQ